MVLLRDPPNFLSQSHGHAKTIQKNGYRHASTPNLNLDFEGKAQNAVIYCLFPHQNCHSLGGYTMIIIPLKHTHFLPLGTKPTPAADIFHALHSLEGWIQFWGSTRSATCRCQVAEMLEWWQSSNPQGAHQPGMVLKPQMTYPSPGTCMKRHSYSWQLKDSQFRKCGVFTADAVLGFWDLLAASCGYRKLYCFHPAKSGNRLEKERAGPTRNIPAVLDSISRIRFKYFSVKMFEPQRAPSAQYRWSWAWNAHLGDHPSCHVWSNHVKPMQICPGYNDVSSAPRIAKRSQAFSELPGHRWLHKSISLAGKVGPIPSRPGWRWPLTIWEVGVLGVYLISSHFSTNWSAVRVLRLWS